MPASNLEGNCFYSRGRLIFAYEKQNYTNWSLGRAVVRVLDVGELIPPDHVTKFKIGKLSRQESHPNVGIGWS